MLGIGLDLWRSAIRGPLAASVLSNLLHNPTGMGAVAGTPGTAPSTWVVSTTANGLTRSIVGTGIENGIAYVDVRWVGTTSAGSSTISYFDGVAGVPATIGQEFVGSAYVKLQAGSLNGITANALRLVERDVGGGFAAGGTFGATAFTPTNAALNTQGRSVTFAMTVAPTRFTQLGHRFDYTTAQAVDVTFRYGLPAILSNAINYFYDVTAVIAAGAGGNTSAAAAAPPVLTYDLTNKELWPGYGDNIGDWGDTYMTEGVSSVQAATNIRNWLVNWATNDYLRINASTTYVNGIAKDYASELGWALCSFVPAYLKSQSAAAFSNADRVLIRGWLSNIGTDLIAYYNWQTDALSSKHNNHMAWAMNALATIAVATNRRDCLNYAILSIKHILDHTYSDVIKEDSVFRRLVGYESPPDDTYPPGGLQLELDRGDSSFFYQAYWTGTATIVAAIAAKNNVDLFGYAGVYGSMLQVYDFWKINVTDGGQTIFDLLTEHQPAPDRPASKAALSVSTHSVDANKFASFLIFAAKYPAHAASATINTNMAGGTNTQHGGNIAYLVSHGYVT